MAINDVNPVLVKKPEPDGVELIEDGPMEIHEYEHPVSLSLLLFCSVYICLRYCHGPLDQTQF